MSKDPPKRGLGRGLSALLGDAQVPTSPGSASDALREIAIDRIRPNPHQPRRSFDQAALDELQASIAEYGVLVPIIVRERDGAYELIAGERRWRACAALRRSTIPGIVRRSDDRDSLEVAIIENLQRENLNALEEAAGYQSLIDDYAFTQEQVAARLGKSRPAVANALRLLTLSEPIKAMLADGRLSAGHGRALLAAPESRRLVLAERVVTEGLPVRALERLATETPRKPPRAAKPRTLDAAHADFESRLRTRLGAPVKLVPNGTAGRIEIRYANGDDLMRVADLLLDLE